MLIDIETLRDALIALAIVALAAVLFYPTTAHAQFGGSAVNITGDEVTVSTADSSADSSLSDIDTQTSAIDTSVTTGGAAGLWQPQDSDLTQLNANLNQGIDTAQKFAANFTGWQPLPANAATMIKNLTTLSLNTYGGALTVAQQQVQGFQAEDSQLANIEQENQGITSMLQGQQLIVEAILALCQQIQRERQLMTTLINLEAVSHAEQLQERAAAGATDATFLNLGVTP
jgi:hypothetical protein